MSDSCTPPHAVAPQPCLTFHNLIGAHTCIERLGSSRTDGVPDLCSLAASVCGHSKHKRAGLMGCFCYVEGHNNSRAPPSGEGQCQNTNSSIIPVRRQECSLLSPIFCRQESAEAPHLQCLARNDAAGDVLQLAPVVVVCTTTQPQQRIANEPFSHTDSFVAAPPLLQSLTLRSSHPLTHKKQQGANNYGLAVS